MKKFMALCLTIIMVFSMFTVAVSAATITVPAYTAFDQSFAGITEAPANFTLAGNYSIQETYIKGTKGGFSMLYNNEVVTGGADYKYTVNFSLSNTPVYIHLGAATPADAIAAKVADTGYTLRARTGIGGDYTYAAYDLYKNGVLVSEEYNYDGYYYQSLHTVAIEVTGESIILTGSFAGSPVTIADAEPITSGYAGVFVGENTLNKSGLGSMKLEVEAFSYDVNTSGAATGGYLELDGADAFNQSFAGLSTAPEGWTITGSNYEYLDDSIHAKTGNGEAFMLKNDKFNTNGADYTFSVNIAASNKVSYVHFGANNTADAINAGASATGYTLSIAPNSSYLAGKYTLYKNGTQIGQYELYSGYGYQYLKTITINVTSSAISISSSSGVVDTIADTAPITSGYIGVALRNNNVTWGAKLDQISLDYNATKSNFLLDKSFANADADELAALGFTVNSTGIDANGIYKTQGEPDVSYATKFGGSYTIESHCNGNFNNPDSFVFNKTEDGDYYQFKAAATEVILNKVQGGTTTELKKVTYANREDADSYWKFDRKNKIVVTAKEDGTKNIKVYLNGTLKLEADDEAPITKAGTVKVIGGYNGTTVIKDLKVYPGATAPVIAGEFLVNGTSSAVKGDTVFTFPVMMLAQNADVIAALYEDGKMTDIKMVDFDTLNSEGYAQLFNTTASKANDVNVKVFIWDSLAGMTPVTNAFELNK